MKPTRSAKRATRCSTAHRCGASPQQWNSDGLKTAKGYTWTGGKVRQVLPATQRRSSDYDGEILDGVKPAWKPIVKRDVWESVCALLADPKRHTGNHPAASIC